jgi:hypothetical protein
MVAAGQIETRLAVVSRNEGRRAAQRERVARSPGAPAEAASRAGAALTGRTGRAHLSRRAREKPAAEGDFSTVSDLAGPARQKPSPEPDFCSGDSSAAGAGRTQSCRAC